MFDSRSIDILLRGFALEGNLDGVIGVTKVPFRYFELIISLSFNINQLILIFIDIYELDCEIERSIERFQLFDPLSPVPAPPPPPRSGNGRHVRFQFQEFSNRLDFLFRFGSSAFPKRVLRGGVARRRWLPPPPPRARRSSSG